jgi:hypothetical protein
MVLDHLRTVVGLRIVAHVAGPTAIRSAIARLYKSHVSGSPFEPVSPEPATPQARLATAPELRPVIAGQAGGASAAVLLPVPVMNGANGTLQPIVPAVSTPSAGSEAAAKREAAALKALVELLVQKGVITMDEYLARLKR